MNKIPVFFINGILDSGKTSFIIDTIHSDGFDGNTLLIVCEQGEVEYDEKDLKNSYKTSIQYFKDVSEFNEVKLSNLVKDYEPDRIVIEFNGMWDLTKIQFPYYLELVQTISFIDTSTFELYFNNMRQKINDMIAFSDATIFTKYDDVTKQIEPYKNALKMMNNRCSFYVMNQDFRAFNAFEEPLPYDINSEIIQISMDDYVTFYIDTFEHRSRYEDKIVEYDCMVVKTDKLPKNSFIGGRMIMNCCENDTQLYGFLVKYKNSNALKDRSWVHIKGKIKIEFSKEYNEDEIIIYAEDVQQIENQEEVLDLTQK